MSYSIQLTKKFERQIKKLIKKYPSLRQELQLLAAQLKVNPASGTPLGHDCYKIRLSIASKGKGKSGGARVIIHVYVSSEKIYLLTTYDKSEKETITDKELIELLQSLSR